MLNHFVAVLTVLQKICHKEKCIFRCMFPVNFFLYTVESHLSELTGSKLVLIMKNSKQFDILLYTSISIYTCIYTQVICKYCYTQ